MFLAISSIFEHKNLHFPSKFVFKRETLKKIWKKYENHDEKDHTGIVLVLSGRNFTIYSPPVIFTTAYVEISGRTAVKCLADSKCLSFSMHRHVTPITCFDEWHAVKIFYSMPIFRPSKIQHRLNVIN